MLNVPELFQQWRLRCSKVSQKILWNLSIFAGFWKIWNERNNRIFRNKSTEVEEIADLLFGWCLTGRFVIRLLRISLFMSHLFLRKAVFKEGASGFR